MIHHEALMYETRPRVYADGGSNMIRQIYSMTVDNMRTCRFVDSLISTLGFVREPCMTILYHDAYVINL